MSISENMVLLILSSTTVISVLSVMQWHKKDRMMAVIAACALVACGTATWMQLALVLRF